MTAQEQSHENPDIYLQIENKICQVSNFNNKPDAQQLKPTI